MKKLTQGMDEQNKRMASASDEVKEKIVSIALEAIMYNRDNVMNSLWDI